MHKNPPTVQALQPEKRQRFRQLRAPAISFPSYDPPSFFGRSTRQLDHLANLYAENVDWFG